MTKMAAPVLTSLPCLLVATKDICEGLIADLQIVPDLPVQQKKSRIRETSNLSTDADRRTDTILKRLCDLSNKKK